MLSVSSARHKTTHVFVASPALDMRFKKKKHHRRASLGFSVGKWNSLQHEETSTRA